MQEEALIEKIRSLSPDRAAEVEDFVDFLLARERDRGLIVDFTSASESAFAEVWDDPANDIYDDL
jgi:hypothetical protein